MDITNTTGQDAPFKVSGGGSGMDHPHPHDVRIEDAESWPVLRAGSRISYNPKSDGPWTVYFVVHGKSFSATTQSASSQLTLTQSGASFHVQVD